MSAEIAALLEAAEVRAEALLGLIRLLVAASVLVVLVAATRELPAEVAPMLERQVWLAYLVLAAFSVHGAVTLALARRGRLGVRGRYVVATLDVLFVAVNLALNLRNTGLAANWVTSLPALWLLPLLLAYAAIRFDPRLAAWIVGLMLASLVAVTWGAGWERSPLPQPPAVLAAFHSLPPMVVRAVMLLLAGVVVVAAVARARDLLLRGLETERRRLNLTRYLPPQLADELAQGRLEELRRGRRQQAVVLFADLRGFTGRAETMPPEELGRFLTAFRSRVSTVVDRHGGMIDKFIGDAAMVVFGVPAPAGGDAARAVACAEDLLADAEAWSAELEAAGQPPVALSIGAHAGEVFAGVVGDERRLEYTLLGDVVNSAQRLQARAAEAGFALLASAPLLAAAGVEASPGWTALQPQLLRGRRQPMAVLGRHRVGQP